MIDTSAFRCTRSRTRDATCAFVGVIDDSHAGLFSNAINSVAVIELGRSNSASHAVAHATVPDRRALASNADLLNTVATAFRH